MQRRTTGKAGRIEENRGDSFVIKVNRKMLNLRPLSWLNPPPVYIKKNPAAKAKMGNENMFLWGPFVACCSRVEWSNAPNIWQTSLTPEINKV